MRFVLAATGILAAILLAVALVGHSTATEISDPTGDTFGDGGVDQLDISSIDAQFGSGNLAFTVTFATSIQPTSAGASNSVEGSIFIDTDQNPDTGGPIADVGAEFALDLSTVPGQADVVEITSGNVVGTASVVFTSNSFTATVSLSLLGGDSGLVDYYVLVAAPEPPPSEYIFFTDEAPNQGAATSEAAPSPAPTPSPTPAELPAGGAATGSSSNFPMAFLVVGLILAVSAAATIRVTRAFMTNRR